MSTIKQKIEKTIAKSLEDRGAFIKEASTKNENNQKLKTPLYFKCFSCSNYEI